MTVIWRNDEPRLRRRSPRESTGKVLYGYPLRDLLSDRPPATMSERNRRMRALFVVAIVVLIGAISIAAVIVL